MLVLSAVFVASRDLVWVSFKFFHTKIQFKNTKNSYSNICAKFAYSGYIIFLTSYFRSFWLNRAFLYFRLGHLVMLKLCRRFELVKRFLLSRLYSKIFGDSYFLDCLYKIVIPIAIYLANEFTIFQAKLQPFFSSIKFAYLHQVYQNK